jgi:hypothetical protein
MKRLIEKGLMFGNLIPVDSAALVERYNRALKHLTGRETRLPDFHIDISGFSPEIGHELGDELYLNADGCNRQFILLTTEQKTAPLLNAKFSTSRGILRQFIELNEPQLFALTAQDAVAGELENSVFVLDSPARLFDIRRIRVVADTIGAHVADATRLARLIERFRTEPDAWLDDVLIAEMITLAQKTGDVTRTPLIPQHDTFEQKNFWTGHFGGIYVFRDLPAPAAIRVDPAQAPGPLPIPLALNLSERNAIADWLARNDLVEPIVKARGVDAAAILRQKMDFILVDAAETLGLDLAGATRGDLRAIARRLGTALPEEFQGLAALLRWAEGGGPWPAIGSDHPAYFHALRSKPHADRDLVNMLLAELAPADVRQLFICHKALFYRRYAGWSEARRGWVADFLEREYLTDKAGARAALFGADAPMAEPPPAPARPPAPGPWTRVPAAGRAPRPAERPDDRLAAVGPWGAVDRLRQDRPSGRDSPSGRNGKPRR